MLPQVYVDFRSDNASAALERRYRDYPWVSVCTAPCERTLRPDMEYRVGGEDAVRSKPFFIYRPTTIFARVGSRSQRTTGIVAVSIGIPLLVFGTFLTLLSGGRTEDGWVGPPWQLGAITMGLGGALTVAGAVLMSTNNTFVELRDRGPVAKLTWKF
jgi:hypothetical protein